MAGEIFGAAVQGGLGMLNNIMGQEREEAARRENYMYGEMAAKNADARTRALYQDFYSPEAMLRQYNKAGLSPSMMFGGTPGQGGMSGAQGTGAAGPSSTYMPISMLEGAQIGLMTAQAENIKADTKKKEEETETVKETRSPQISVMLAEAGYKNAATELTKLTATFQEMANYVKENTKDFEIKTVENNMYKAEHEAEYALWEAANAKIQFEFNEATFDTRVQQTKQELANLYWDTMLKQAQKTLTEEQVNLIKTQEVYYKQLVNESIEKIAQGWKQLALEKRGQDITWADIKSQLHMQGANYQLQKQALKLQERLGEKGISQGYWNIGANTFNHVIDGASRITGLWMFGGANKQPAAQPSSPGSPSPILYY